MKDIAKKMVYWAIFSDIAYHIFMFFIIILVAYMIYIGKIAEATSYITIMLSIDQLDNNLYTLFENGQEVNQLSLYVNDIQKFYQASVEEDGKDLQQVNHFPFQIQLHDVTFQYDHSAFALRNINMDIHAGETIAIVGENGAGKSTLLKLLLRLYSPQSGTIFINEKDINEYNINTLRNSIGAVFQDGNIYALSLKENLELYDKSDDSAANESLKSVDLTNILEKNHCDLSTELTKEFKEDGIVFSGGEVQKLGLARILGKKFGLLVLDEPSAALDPIAEEHMMRLIQEKIKTTTIIVAHRLSTVRHASQIFVMKSGRIIEHGTHEELMNVGGYYKEMFDTQSKNYKD